jgi:hypothetical protein
MRLLSWTISATLAAELDSVEIRVQRSPAMVRVGTGAGTESTTVQFSWPQFAEALRVMTYSAPRSQAVPLLVHRAFGGDYTGFAAGRIGEELRRPRASGRSGVPSLGKCHAHP